MVGLRKALTHTSLNVSVVVMEMSLIVVVFSGQLSVLLEDKEGPETQVKLASISVSLLLVELLSAVGKLDTSSVKLDALLGPLALLSQEDVDAGPVQMPGAVSVQVLVPRRVKVVIMTSSSLLLLLESGEPKPESEAVLISLLPVLLLLEYQDTNSVMVASTVVVDAHSVV